MKTVTILLTLIFVVVGYAEIINVPDNFETVQGAINEAEAGDTVLVAPGIYEENIITEGKADLTIGSMTLITGDPAYIDSTVLDGGGAGIVIDLSRMERDAVVTLQGFTIRNGTGNNGGGVVATGAIFASLIDLYVTENQGNIAGISANSIWDAHLRRVRIINNDGRGIWISATRSSLVDCEVSENQNGGGYMGAQILSLTNVAFLDNELFGLTLGPSTARALKLDRLTIAGTRMVEDENGVGLVLDAGNVNRVNAELTNSIIFANEGSAIALNQGNGGAAVDLFVAFSDVQGGEDGVSFIGDGDPDLVWGNGNIDDDPLFVDSDAGDYHLTVDSPCIDAGDPDSGDDLDDTRADMGAYYYHQRDPDDEGFLHVPDEYATIQAAIDASEDGDTVMVADGTYEETVNFDGKAITVGSRFIIDGDWDHVVNTIIDGSGERNGVTFWSGEGNESVLSGFTIRNCVGVQRLGGGISCYDGASPTLSGLIVRDNQDAGIGTMSDCYPILQNITVEDNNGDGVQIEANRDGAVFISNCRISNNEGAGLICTGSRVEMNHTLISGNTSVNAGGVYLGASHGNVFTNVTIVGNRCHNDDRDGGIYYGGFEGSNSSSLSMLNSIVYGNEPTQIGLRGVDEGGNISSLQCSYSDVDGGEDGIVVGQDNEVEWGDGNIDADPLFTDPDGGDYHLTENSPCIDAGDPDSPEDPDRSRVEMGAFYFPQLGFDGIRHVPGEYETIQEAITASIDGDTVLVAPGLYVENIDFTGKAIVVMGNPDDPSEVVIDGDANGRSVVAFRTEETDESVLTGFTIRNGESDNGGGIYCNGASPVLCNLVVSGNRAAHNGGGIYITTVASPVINDVVISDNYSSEGGGMACNDRSHVTALNVIISGNSASDDAGGVQCSRSQLTMYKSIVANNESGDSGGGFTCTWGSVFQFENGLIFGNVANIGAVILELAGCEITVNSSIITGNMGELFSGLSANDTISYSNVQGGYAGDGNIDEDPLFVDSDAGDFHLTENSPCIDSGDPDSPNDPDGTRADMGPYYFPQRDPDNRIRLVPEEYATIQEAVNASTNGDTVLVAPGEYIENNIFIPIWELTIASQYIIDQDENYIARTVVDADSNGCVFDFGWCDSPPRDQEEGVNIIGFTIQGASNSGFVGWGASFSIDHCIVQNNSGENGGAMFLGHGNNVTMTNSVFTNNRAVNGGVVYNSENNNRIVSLNCVFVGNSAEQEAGLFYGGEHIVVNSILWDNGDAIITGDQCTVSYSDVQGGWEGESNINSDPLFVNVDMGNFYLNEDSPCIDAGTPIFVWEEDTLLNLTEGDYFAAAPDMGAFEFGLSGIEPENSDLPINFALLSIYPNPFNSNTTINYTLPRSQKVAMRLYDMAGRLVETLYDDFQTAGHHSVVWDSRDFGSGIYLLQVRTNGETKNAKLVAIK